MITRRLLLGSALAVGFACPAHAETLNILMEGVPDTEYVKELVPEFEAERPASRSISRSSTTPRCTPSWCRSWSRRRAATR